MCFLFTAVGVYSVFFYDFGDREHVFSPIRRWTRTGIGLVFSLSPTEEQLLYQKTDDKNTTTTTSSQQK